MRKRLQTPDFNGDGKPDVLEQGSGTLLVLLGNGDGTFQTTPVSTPIAAGLSPVAAVDLNGDGKTDVVGVSNSALYVYLNNGDGTFASSESYNVSLNRAAVLSVGDFNGDHKIDIAISTGDAFGTAGQVIVLLGNGDGTFLAPKTSTGASGPISGQMGDFNGGGKLDLAINNCDLIYGCLAFVLGKWRWHFPGANICSSRHGAPGRHRLPGRGRFQWRRQVGLGPSR